MAEGEVIALWEEGEYLCVAVRVAGEGVIGDAPPSPFLPPEEAAEADKKAAELAEAPATVEYIARVPREKLAKLSPSEQGQALIAAVAALRVAQGAAPEKRPAAEPVTPLLPKSVKF